MKGSNDSMMFFPRPAAAFLRLGCRRDGRQPQAGRYELGVFSELVAVAGDLDDDGVMQQPVQERHPFARAARFVRGQDVGPASRTLRLSAASTVTANASTSWLDVCGMKRMARAELGERNVREGGGGGTLRLRFGACMPLLLRCVLRTGLAPLTDRIWVPLFTRRCLHKWPCRREPCGVGRVLIRRTRDCIS